eukprot:CAMPEP_0178404772 /NCGR_PEP_ID=MMETSP0689_2-20121128/18060_1 /TAXON_ID=160604 /ORGANISM="Amphidinium massartii, Strain CS-259" /LENGTH=587 /DNA_ID=CAMNT_0020025775 /DNA_START=142 /DNA_END=1902 /DNA_ORIENTATION=+
MAHHNQSLLAVLRLSCLGYFFLGAAAVSSRAFHTSRGEGQAEEQQVLAALLHARSGQGTAREAAANHATLASAGKRSHLLEHRHRSTRHRRSSRLETTLDRKIFGRFALLGSRYGHQAEISQGPFFYNCSGTNGSSTSAWDCPDEAVAHDAEIPPDFEDTNDTWASEHPTTSTHVHIQTTNTTTSTSSAPESIADSTSTSAAAAPAAVTSNSSTTTLFAENASTTTSAAANGTDNETATTTGMAAVPVYAESSPEATSSTLMPVTTFFASHSTSAGGVEQLASSTSPDLMQPLNPTALLPFVATTSQPVETSLQATVEQSWHREDADRIIATAMMSSSVASMRTTSVRTSSLVPSATTSLLPASMPFTSTGTLSPSPPTITLPQELQDILRPAATTPLAGTLPVTAATTSIVLPEVTTSPPALTTATSSSPTVAAITVAETTAPPPPPEVIVTEKVITTTAAAAAAPQTESPLVTTAAAPLPKAVAPELPSSPILEPAAVAPAPAPVAAPTPAPAPSAAVTSPAPAPVIAAPSPASQVANAFGPLGTPTDAAAPGDSDVLSDIFRRLLATTSTTAATAATTSTSTAP